MDTIDYSSINSYGLPHPRVALVEYSTDKFISDLLIKNEKLQGLRRDVGDSLFLALSDEDKDFILNTEGSVDFGYKISSTNFHEIEKNLREDYEY